MVTELGAESYVFIPILNLKNGVTTKIKMRDYAKSTDNIKKLWF